MSARLYIVYPNFLILKNTMFFRITIRNWLVVLVTDLYGTELTLFWVGYFDLVFGVGGGVKLPPLVKIRNFSSTNLKFGHNIYFHEYFQKI